ncbi:MAG: proteobacterial dedicated sortase system histidine kinase [Gammaproteobacteria bacterium]|jgi:dedicated sortase system histidine kinase|nr:proteobacterial dedicated sortase system histidine kinase [Gammaproteobacteria bacterium]
MTAFFKPLFSLRIKLLMLSSLLLVIPWLGYSYILEMEQYLSRGQEQTVLGTARALATALSERPELFNEGSYSREQSRAQDSQDLYVYPVFQALSIEDGNLLDWRDYRQYEQHYQESSLIPNPENQLSSFQAEDQGTDPLSFRLMLGEHNDGLYIYFRVIDDNVVLRSRDGLRVDRSDSLRISLLNRDGGFERYVIAPYADEIVYPFRIGSDVTDFSALEHESRISGRWSRIPEGYEMELRFPLAMVGSKLGLAIFDVDSPQTRSVTAIVSTSGIDNPAELGTLRRPTPEIDRIVAGMGHTNSRVQVVDRSQRVLLSVGDIQTATGLVLDQVNEKNGLLSWLENNVLHPLYYRVITRPTTDFVDDLYQGGVVDGDHLIPALTGQATTRYRSIENDNTRILEAAYPIVASGQVLGAVVVDQNMNGIRTFRNQALETLFDTMLGILLLTMAALFIFATSLSSRIRGLRNQAEKIVDDSGRINNTIAASRSADEIGDLSRSFASIVDRLSQYTHYLENMSSRLSHELRTPVTVVRSSLENLSLVSQEEEAQIYIQRAEEGITRLNLILTNMSEAARLEQILQSSDKEEMDLSRVIDACVQEYQQIYPTIEFESKISLSPIRILGNADYIAQLMDKLIANAVEFSSPEKPVRVACYADNGEAVVSIANSGPYLDHTMKDRIFDSMVSVRPESKKKQPHLGMGLHIARMVAEFHRGFIVADNLIEEEGVIVVLRIPLSQ